MSDPETYRLITDLQELQRENMTLKAELAAEKAKVKQLTDWQNEAAGVMAQYIHASSKPDEATWGAITLNAVRLLSSPA
mgnify:CR=1 FL=1